MYFERLFLLLNEYCDSRCRMCDYWLIKNPARMSLAFVDEFVLPLLQRYAIQVVCVSGGEPTLHPELAAIVGRLKAAGTRVTLTTSTSQLGDHFEKLKELVDHYLISLDGATADVYSRCRGVDLFHHVIDAVRLIRTSTTADVALSFLIQKSNIQQVEDVYDLSCDLGVDELFYRVPDVKDFSFGRVHLPRRSQAQLEIGRNGLQSLREQIERVIRKDVSRGILGQARSDLLRKISWYECLVENKAYREQDAFCDVPLTSFVVDAAGLVKPCFYLPYREALTSRLASDGLASAHSFQSTYSAMLKSPRFREVWCQHCQQFDGHKIASESGGVSHDRAA